MIQTLLLVALGGAIGSSARYLVGAATLRLLGAGFPWATLAVNILGSFVMGGLVVYLAHKGLTRHAPFLMTGLLGGFTTFSAFSLDAVALWQRGELTASVAYVGGSVVCALAALLAGMAFARGILA
jgi:CrcB protein